MASLRWHYLALCVQQHHWIEISVVINCSLSVLSNLVVISLLGTWHVTLRQRNWFLTLILISLSWNNHRLLMDCVFQFSPFSSTSVSNSKFHPGVWNFYHWQQLVISHISQQAQMHQELCIWQAGFLFLHGRGLCSEPAFVLVQGTAAHMPGRETECEVVVCIRGPRS